MFRGMRRVACYVVGSINSPLRLVVVERNLDAAAKLADEFVF